MRGLVIIAAVSAVILVSLYKNSRFGVATPSYEVVLSDADFEIRRYSPMVLVGTSLETDDINEGTSFMRLFRYISGSNESERKIAMTTPVLTEQEGDQRTMSFIVPADVADEGAPAPDSEDVSLDVFDGGRFAVYRFSGNWDRSRFERRVAELRKWMREQNLEAIDLPMAANYDPPFTPSFLRRNEVLIQIQPPS